MGERFSIIYSEEAMTFLKSLPKKASEKIKRIKRRNDEVLYT